MTTFRQRFVGATELPKTLTEFDVEQSFQLSKDDLDVIRKRFRTTGRLAAAIQLTVIRTTGRPLDRLTNVPRAVDSTLQVSHWLTWRVESTPMHPKVTKITAKVLRPFEYNKLFR